MSYSKIIRYVSAQVLNHTKYIQSLLDSKTIPKLVTNFNPSYKSWQNTLHIKTIGSIIRDNASQLIHLEEPACQQIINDSLTNIENFTYQEFIDICYFLRACMYYFHIPYSDESIKKIIDSVGKPKAGKTRFKPLCSLVYQLAASGIMHKKLWAETIEEMKKERIVRITDLKEILFAFNYDPTLCENIWVNIIENVSHKVLKDEIQVNDLIDYCLKYEELCVRKSRPVNPDIISLVVQEVKKKFNKDSLQQVSSLIESLKRSNVFVPVYDDYVKALGSISDIDSSIIIENLAQYSRLKDINRELAEGFIGELDNRFAEQKKYDPKRIKKVVVALKAHNLPFKSYDMLFSNPKIGITQNAANFFGLMAIVPELTQKSLMGFPAFDKMSVNMESMLKSVTRFDLFNYFLLMNSLEVFNEETKKFQKNAVERIKAKTDERPLLALPIVKECLYYNFYVKLPVFKEIYDVCYPKIPEGFCNKDEYKTFF